MKIMMKLVAAIAIGLTIAAKDAPASTFVAWQVTGVGTDDTLNVRAEPTTGGDIQVAYPDGTPLSMTGRCSNGVDLKSLAGLPAWKQKIAVRRAWCEIWHDPAGTQDWRAGWVYGRYIQPRQE